MGRGGYEDGGDEGRGIGELRELQILVLGGTGENTHMSACTSGIHKKFFRDGSFFILANTPLGVVRRMEGGAIASVFLIEGIFPAIYTRR